MDSEVGAISVFQIRTLICTRSVWVSWPSLCSITDSGTSLSLRITQKAWEAGTWRGLSTEPLVQQHWGGARGAAVLSSQVTLLLSIPRSPVRMVVHRIPCLWSHREHRDNEQGHGNVSMVQRGKKVNGIKYRAAGREPDLSKKCF